MAWFVRILIVLVASLLVSPLPGAEAAPPPVTIIGPSTTWPDIPTFFEAYISQAAGTPPFYVTWETAGTPPQTDIVNGYSAYRTFSWPTLGEKRVSAGVKKSDQTTLGYGMKTVEVESKAQEQPPVSYYPGNLYWGTTGTCPPPQTVYVTNWGPNNIYWTAVPSADWITVYPPYGSIGNTPYEVGIYVSSPGLPLGTNTGYVTIYSGGWEVGKVYVGFNIFDPTTAEPPFGSFDTPIDGSTVSGSIPVTGWALDDTGVNSVKIYREEGQNLVYIGDAVFVEGARPDVETSYSQYPLNHKAGWGYMMLTNFLPNGGNGTYTIHAIATDTGETETTLGTKTITCDNANAVKPFGAIDTPTQGGTASGSSFTNWGWVLTPQPNSIPTNGSTINVYVDGVNLGHPTYNTYRSDIAGLFPGYANSNGAVGYFSLDTTSYANGVHTIQWTATDNAGNTDGIGSRYFSIQNTGYESSMPDALFQQRAGGSLGGTVTTQVVQLDPVSYTMGSDNLIQVDVGTLLGASGGTYTGFSLHDSLLGPLPVGSTLDSADGIFFWQPGPAFNGQFQMRFIHTAAGGEQVSIDVTIARVLAFVHTVTTDPAGLQIVVDGSTYTAPHTFDWTPDSSHTISVSTPQNGGEGTQYIFSSWSDGGAQDHTITAASSSTTYTANFTIQYSLTTSVAPSMGGNVSPSGANWYNSGQGVEIEATPGIGCTFSHWTGDLSGSANPTSITMNSPKTVTANFTTTSVTPTAYDFENVKVKKSKRASFVVKNSGKTNLSITSAITGTDASMFKITAGSGSKTIKPGKKLTIKVAFKPTSTGPRSANLEITTNDPVRPTFDIPLSGTGL